MNAMLNGTSNAIMNNFDAEFANQIAQLESYNKHLYRPNTYLHKWWARRCGSTFRLLLKILVEDESKANYYSPGGLEGKIVLDPMMGGGTVIHEAIRLGANVIGMDLDPIPVLQARATLNSIELDDLRQAFNQFLKALTLELDEYFKTNCSECGAVSALRFILYGAERYCGCGRAILIDSYVIREEADGSTLEICPNCGTLRRNGCCDCQKDDSAVRIYTRRVKHCPECRERLRVDKSRPYFERFTPLVIVGKCGIHGTFYKEPSEIDQQLIAQANQKRQGIDYGTDLKIVEGPKSKALIQSGIGSFAELFSSRQLLYITLARKILGNFNSIERLYLALLVSSSLEFNSMLCGYKGNSVRRSGAIRHVFSHHGYSFPYTALENNPLFARSRSGTLRRLFKDRVVRARKWALSPRERNVGAGSEKYRVIMDEVDMGEEVSEPDALAAGSRRYLLRQASATKMPLESGSVDFVVTDPPYYDSVQYSDLSNFFRVWLRQFIPEEVLHGIDWNYQKDLSAVSSVDKRPTSGHDLHYTDMVRQIMSECYRVLRKGQGRLIMSYHHWDPRAWTSLTIALKHAGFLLEDYYIVHSESPRSVHIDGQRSITHDALLILAPRDKNKSKFEENRQRWSKPQGFQSTDSYEFCQNCSKALAWMLEQNLAEIDVYDLWRDLIKMA